MRKWINSKNSRVRNLAAGMLLVVLLAILFVIIPLAMELRPEISGGSIAMLERVTVLEKNAWLVLYGRHISEMDCLFVNGHSVAYTVVPDEEKITVTETNEQQKEHINIQFDISPFADSKKLVLQTAKNTAGIIRLKSNKYIIDLVDTDLTAAQITGTDCREIICPQETFWLTVQGRGIDRHTRILLNGEEQNTDYSDKYPGVCRTKVDQEVLKGCADNLDVQLVQYTDGNMPTKLESNVWSVPVSRMKYADYAHTYEWIEDRTQIMHALGGFDQQTHTNSREALTESMRENARVFEFDLSFDKDGVLVGRYDWSQSLLEAASPNLEKEEINGLPLSYTELKEALKERYTVISFEELVQVLVENPDYYVITDTKYEDETAVDAMFQELVRVCLAYDEKVLDRIVVQVYTEEMYGYLMKVYPFHSVIYTLYRTEDTEEEVLRFLSASNVRAVTLPAKSRWDNDEFVQALKEIGCSVFAHTINDFIMENDYLERGFSGVYTDDLTPAKVEKWLNEKERRHVETKDLLNVSDGLQYLKALKKCPFTILITARDDVSNVKEIRQALEELGLECRMDGAFRESYIAVIDQNKVWCEEVSPDVLKHTYYTSQDHLVELTSAGNGAGNKASVLINGKECAGDLRGLNIVVFDAVDNEVIDSVVIDTFEEGKLAFTRVEGRDFKLPADISGYSSNKKRIINYFQDLQNSNLVVMMVVQDEATMLVDDQMMEEMAKIGMSKNYRAAFRNSYLAVFDGGKEITQQFDEEKALEYTYEIGCDQFTLASGGNGSGVQASITWNGTEMAETERGLHILVYDKLTGMPVSYCRMDLFDSLECEITELNKEIYE